MEERIFKPGVYRHFKENKPLKERMYYGIAQTIPVSDDVFDKTKNFSAITIFAARHTETGDIIKVALCSDGTWKTKGGESFIFYRALYGDMKHYLRPVKMFLSPRDAVKYPQFSQYWRMEKIG